MEWLCRQSAGLIEVQTGSYFGDDDIIRIEERSEVLNRPACKFPVPEDT